MSANPEIMQKILEKQDMDYNKLENSKQVPEPASKITLTRNERRLLERETAKAAKRKPIVSNASSFHTWSDRDEQSNKLVEQLTALDVYKHLPPDFDQKMTNHTVTGDTWESDYPLEEVGRTLEIRFYNEKSKHSYSNLRNTASTTSNEKQQRGYDRLEHKLQEVRDSGKFSN